MCSAPRRSITSVPEAARAKVARRLSVYGQMPSYAAMLRENRTIDFERAERMAVLTGRDSPEFFDKALFKGYLDTLIDAGLVRVGDEKRLIVDPQLEQIAERSLELLSDESRQTLLQLISRRPGAAPEASRTQLDAPV